MEDLDKVIAKLKLAKKIEEEQQENDEEQNNKKDITLEEVISKIRDENKILIGDKVIEFENREFFNNKLSIPLMKNFFEEKVNTKENINLSNTLQAINFNASYLGNVSVDKTFDEFKNGMQQTFQHMGMHFEWLEDGVNNEGDEKLPQINYGAYKVETNMENIYNMIFYTNHENTLIMGNLNCLFKDFKIWGIIIKAIILLAKVR